MSSAPNPSFLIVSSTMRSSKTVRAGVSNPSPSCAMSFERHIPSSLPSARSTLSRTLWGMFSSPVRKDGNE